MENTIAKKFRRTLLLFLTLFFVLSQYACFEVDNNLNKALEYAGNNKTELLKVLQHYKQCDAEKYNAACFLIKNMPYYGFYKGEALSDCLRYFETYATKDMTPQEVIDSLEKIYGKFDIRRYLILF